MSQTIGMPVTAVPPLWPNNSLMVPIKALLLGAPIGLLMALGSISYVLALSKLQVGTAAAISTSYIVLVVLLSRILLGERLSWMKIVGISPTIVGVVLLSWEQKTITNENGGAAISKDMLDS